MMGSGFEVQSARTPTVSLVVNQNEIQRANTHTNRRFITQNLHSAGHLVAW
jgi:hypothetical protein